MVFEFFRREVTGTRYSGGEYIGGVWQPGTPEALTISASVQPTKPRDLEMLPEGRRVMQSFRLYSDDLLRTAEENGEEADTVTIDGETFEVHQLAPWQNGLLNHNRYLVVRRQPE